MKVRLIASLLGVLSLAGCSSKVGLVGSWYSGYTEGAMATPQVSVKSGEACAMSILGIIAVGDASIDTARKNGGIRSISSVDEQYTNILGIYMSKCTVARGK